MKIPKGVDDDNPVLKSLRKQEMDAALGRIAVVDCASGQRRKVYVAEFMDGAWGEVEKILADCLNGDEHDPLGRISDAYDAWEETLEPDDHDAAYENRKEGQ